MPARPAHHKVKQPVCLALFSRRSETQADVLTAPRYAQPCVQLEYLVMQPEEPQTVNIPRTHRSWKRLLYAGAVLIILLMLIAYLIYPIYCRSSATEREADSNLPGDSIVLTPKAEYTLAKTINAAPHDIWPWLIQMGQGRGGFYTHEWIENLIGADIHNADSIIPVFQYLALGDSIRLTPDPYLGEQPGQYISVAQIDSPNVLVFKQRLPNGGTGSWAYVLNEGADGTTRMVFRRRSSEPSLFDRIALPGYYFMDMGMLSGIKKRTE